MCVIELGQHFRSDKEQLIKRENEETPWSDGAVCIWSGCYTGVHIHPNLKFICFIFNILFTAEGREDCPHPGARRHLPREISFGLSLGQMET